jgi:transcriptional regulator with XRE-family HTH domain
MSSISFHLSSSDSSIDLGADLFVVGPQPAIKPAAPAAKDAKDRDKGKWKQPKRLHRIREVRDEQGVSVRSAARRMGVEMRQVRNEEESSADLKLTDIYRWQEALEVPISDLLVESDAALSRPVLERARLVRLMKTAAALDERAGNNMAIKRLAKMLVEQLCEIMPELKEVGPWHSVGQRRSGSELGRIAEHPISLDSLDDMSSGD